MSEILSYKHILSDIKNFKNSGTYYGSDFNIYDTPSHKYFKILFYFGSQPEFGSGNSSGLLAPTWETVIAKSVEDYLAVDTKNNYSNYSEEELSKAIERAEKYNSNLNLYNYNSAWAYLKINGENERAEKLEHFVTLLSDINTNSPWYFSTVSGVQEALERKVAEDGKLDLTENKKLTITCLPDAFDNRISTLLELYRDVTWSWIHKKEIIPANLRKFDMAIYIFETPELNWHTESDAINSSTSKFKPSYKMIEFHDCEFNYNSIKTGWSELNNQNGITPTYQIEIFYNDCYEISYNDIMMRQIGDVILTDLLNNPSNSSYNSIPQLNDYQLYSEIKSRTNPYNIDLYGKEEPMSKNLSDRKNEINKITNNSNLLGDAINQVAGHLVSDVKSLFNRAVMGNIFGFSLTQLRDQVSDFMQGDIVKTGMTLAQYAREHKNKKEDNTKKIPTGNIFSNNTIANNL